MTDPEVAELWAAYKKSESVAERNRLVEHYYSLVRYVASQLAKGLPQRIERGDLMGYGAFGLIDAIQKFEPDRGWKFESYAMGRIRYSMIDELRRADALPRSVVVQIGVVRTAMSRLENTLGRTPTITEIAEYASLTVDQVAGCLVDSRTPLALDEANDGEDSENANVTAAGADDDPAGNEAVVTDLQGNLAQAIRRLPERERTVLALRYREGLTFEEIANLMGIAVGRVSQVMTDALLHLRNEFAGPLASPLLDRQEYS